MFKVFCFLNGSEYKGGFANLHQCTFKKNFRKKLLVKKKVKKAQHLITSRTFVFPYFVQKAGSSSEKKHMKSEGVIASYIFSDSYNYVFSSVVNFPFKVIKWW